MSIFPKFFKLSALQPSGQKPTSPTTAQVPLPSLPSTPPAIPQASLEEIQAKAREIILEARDEALQIKDRAIKDTQGKLAEIKDQALALAARQKELQSIEVQHANQLREIDIAKNQLDEEKKQLQSQLDSFQLKLEKLSGLSKEEARKILLAEVEKDSQAQMAKIIKNQVDETRKSADDLAREILVDAMQIGATDYVAEYSVSTITLPGEDIKAKIIGKDGRNIRTFENYSGVDLDMDETPGIIRLSCFNSIRREIARVALTRLIKDGRIQPSRIEEYLEKAKTEVGRVMYQEGEKLCHAVGVYNLPRDLVAMLGKFKFRTSYGQNMISHTLEETRIGIKLAHELGANVDTVRMGCLLHDIGKVVEDAEGSHVELGVKLLQKYNIPQTTIDCVAQHHEDEEFTSVESILVYISDAISGSRPGARHENYEEYVKRIDSLEKIAKGYVEVDEAYAIQAGRELRVIVNPKNASDDRIVVLAHEIRDKIQDGVTYPGTVKVTVVRETRASEIAK